MIKKGLMISSLFLLMLLLVGCTKQQTLTCTKEQTISGFKTEDKKIITMQGKEVLKSVTEIRSEATTEFAKNNFDAYVTELDKQFAGIMDKKGINFSSTVSEEVKHFLVAEVDYSKIDANELKNLDSDFEKSIIESIDSKISIEKTKEYSEEQGYTCTIKE